MPNSTFQEVCSGWLIPGDLQHANADQACKAFDWQSPQETLRSLILLVPRQVWGKARSSCAAAASLTKLQEVARWAMTVLALGRHCATKETMHFATQDPSMRRHAVAVP